MNLRVVKPLTKLVATAVEVLVGRQKWVTKKKMGMFLRSFKRAHWTPSTSESAYETVPQRLFPLG